MRVSGQTIPDLEYTAIEAPDGKKLETFEERRRDMSRRGEEGQKLTKDEIIPEPF